MICEKRGRIKIKRDTGLRKKEERKRESRPEKPEKRRKKKERVGVKEERT